MRSVKAFVRKEFPSSKLVCRHTVDDHTFIEVVRTSISVREAISKCGLVAAGASYRSFHKRVKVLGLDTSHFLGQGSNTGRKFPKRKRQLEEYLVIGGPSIMSDKLKKRLISEGVKRHQCERCGITEWMGQPTPIQLDHINGDHSDNRLENLQILCPNCHAQTDTFCGKNIKKVVRPEVVETSQPEF